MDCGECGNPFQPQRRGNKPFPFCVACRPVGSRCTTRRQREKEARWQKKDDAALKARADARADAKAATKAKADRARAERRVAREADRASKPWLKPGLTTAEKYRIRYREDRLFNLSERVRIQMRNRRRFRNMEHTIRKAVAGKVTTPGIEKFVGYTMADLRAHLEAQFDDFMTWDDFAAGRIHIDHKRPVSKFDLDDPDQVRACWALDNLQPLWRWDNFSKGARWEAPAPI